MGYLRIVACRLRTCSSSQCPSSLHLRWFLFTSLRSGWILHLSGAINNTIVLHGRLHMGCCRVQTRNTLYFNRRDIATARGFQSSSSGGNWQLVDSAHYIWCLLAARLLGIVCSIWRGVNMAQRARSGGGLGCLLIVILARAVTKPRVLKETCRRLSETTFDNYITPYDESATA